MGENTNVVSSPPEIKVSPSLVQLNAFTHLVPKRSETEVRQQRLSFPRSVGSRGGRGSQWLVVVTYPVWPSRTFTRCKGHSNDLDKSSFRHDASLDADGNLCRRFERDEEKISPVCGTEFEDAPGIVSAMIASGHGFAILNPFRPTGTAHPILSDHHNLDAIRGRDKFSLFKLHRSPGGQNIYSDPQQVSRGQVFCVRASRHPRIPVDHQRPSAAL